jgi:hypothetical protein
MEDRGDFWIPKRKRARLAKKPSLKEDDNNEDDLTAPEIQKSADQYRKSEFLPDPLDKPTAGRTTHLPSSHHDQQPENLKELLRITLYGNRPKWSPFVDKVNGEIDPVALKRYYDGFKILQRLGCSINSRKSISQPTRKAPSAQPLRTKLTRPSPTTGANAIPVTRRREQTQMQGPKSEHELQGLESEEHT